MKRLPFIKIIQEETANEKESMVLQMDMVCGGSCENPYLDCRSLGVIWRASSVAQGLRTAADVQEQFEKILEKRHEEGTKEKKAESAPVKCIGDALSIITEAAKEAGLSLEEDAWLTVDVGADALEGKDRQGWGLLLHTLGKKWKREGNDLVAAELIRNGIPC